MIPRKQTYYRETIIPKMQKDFNLKNKLQVPSIKKISVNMGVGEAAADAKILEKCMEEMALITGQKPAICRTTKAISNFKTRIGLGVGCRVTLRRVKMYEFLDRLISVALPRIRDFRGVPSNSFDQGGNYSFGIIEQTIFPEVESDRIPRIQGMDVTIVFSSKNKELNKALLKEFGMPFRE
jgi:large subunit ribosomal protein L5